MTDTSLKNNFFLLSTYLSTFYFLTIHGFILLFQNFLSSSKLKSQSVSLTSLAVVQLLAQYG